MSRELDARVAEAMGYAKERMKKEGFSCDHFSISGGYVTVWIPPGVVLTEPLTPSDVRKYENPPAFSTDPAACEELRKECRRRGWCYEEAWYAAADGSDAEFWTWVNDFDLHHISEVSQEEAFCLAFLAAVEAEKGAKQ